MSDLAMLKVWAGSVCVGEMSAADLQQITDDIRRDFRWTQISYHVSHVLRTAGQFISTTLRYAINGTAAIVFGLGVFAPDVLVGSSHPTVFPQGLSAFVLFILLSASMAALWRIAAAFPQKSVTPVDRVRSDMLRQIFNVADPSCVWVSQKPFNEAVAK